MYGILNRAIGQEEARIGLPIKTTMPYLGENFALANNLNQPITLKYPTDTAALILKTLAVDIGKSARLLHSK